MPRQSNTNAVILLAVGAATCFGLGLTGIMVMSATGSSRPASQPVAANRQDSPRPAIPAKLTPATRPIPEPVQVREWNREAAKEVKAEIVRNPTAAKAKYRNVRWRVQATIVEFLTDRYIIANTDFPATATEHRKFERLGFRMPRQEVEKLEIGSQFLFEGRLGQYGYDIDYIGSGEFDDCTVIGKL